MLPPVLVTRQGWRTTFDVHVPEGWPVDVWVELETGEHRGGVDQHDNWNPPRTVDGELVGEATFAIPGDLPLGYHWVHARSGDRQARMSLVVTPHWVGMPARLGERRVWGLATQLYSVRSAGLVGHRRPDRPDRPRRLGGRRARRRLRARQPAARRRAGRADGAVAVPADHAPLRQPDVPAARAHPRARRADPGRPGVAARAAREGRRPGRRPDRPRHRLDRQARRAAQDLRGAPVGGPRPGLRGLPPTRGQRPRRLRHLGGHRRGARRRHADLARRAPAPGPPGRGEVPRGARRGRRVPPVAAVGARRAARRDPARAAPVRHGPRRDDRPRGRRALERRRRVVAAGDVRRRGHRRRAARPVQPERPGLAAATVATRPPGRDGVRAVPAAGRGGAAQRGRAAGRPRDRAVPAVVDPEGRRADRGHVRPLRPRGDDRHPRAGGAPGRRRRRRRGPRHRRAVGPHVPRRARHPRHLDPVVRDGP